MVEETVYLLLKGKARPAQLDLRKVFKTMLGLWRGMPEVVLELGSSGFLAGLTDKADVKELLAQAKKMRKKGQRRPLLAQS